MLGIFTFAIGFAVGYAASVYTWSTVKVWVNGATAEAKALRDKAVALETKVRGL